MPIHPTHRVDATALNLRSEPRIRPGNRLAVLPSLEIQLSPAVEE